MTSSNPHHQAASKRTLTDTFVRGLKAAAPGRRAEYWDAKVPSFGVRVTDRGAKSYVLYTRFPPSDAPARRALGDASKMGLAAARKKAREWLDLIEQGVDPRETARRAKLDEQRAQRITFSVVAEDWLREAVRGQRKAREVEADVRREFIPRWGSRAITEITALDVRDAIKAVKARAPAQARNVLGYVKRLLAWAVAQDVYGLDESPAERLRPKDIIGKKVVRQRVLTDAELRALWRAAETTAYPYGPLFQLLAITGQRKSEVAEARWREFDLIQKLWSIPPERMKGAAAHEVPLTDEAVAVLAALPRFKKGDYLFSTTYGARPVNGFSKAKVRLDRAMTAALGGEVDPFVIHDIRRTMRTGLSALPIPDNVRELVIAHARPGLHKVYDQHSYRQEKRHALTLWAARLRGIVTPPPANVVQLHGGVG
jgi:integrase